MTTKNDTNIQIFFVDMAMRAVIDLHHKFCWLKKNSRLISLRSKLYLGYHNQNKAKILLLLLLLMKKVLGDVNHFAHKISCFERKLLFKSFRLRWFCKGMVTSLYFWLLNFQIDNIIENKQKSSQMWKFRINISVSMGIFYWKHNSLDP